MTQTHPISPSPIPVGHFVDIAPVAGSAQRIHYHEQGEGEVVIFLHGAGTGASGYSNFKGNYPDTCSIQGAFVKGGTDSQIETQSLFWRELLPAQKLYTPGKRFRLPLMRSEAGSFSYHGSGSRKMPG